ncbi:MAG: exo-alpha-sialidase [Ruminococcaceae bacterium]|nr:exo-alpha-sialidase [Oscillospiraceae bacterium]
MKIRRLAILLALLALCSCNGKAPQTTDTPTTSEEITEQLHDGFVEPPYLSSFYDIIKNNAEGSHTELYILSTLEADFRSHQNIDSSVTASVAPYYIRIKELSDGSFIMVYNEVKNGDGVRMLTSADGVNWGGYATVFQPTETKKYANPEVIVLANGDLLCCAAWRITPDYLTNNSKGGIEIKRSTDNGKTWSEAQNVSTGLAWEPYFLQLRSGEVQLYWTNTTRYNLPGGNNTSTGTALLRSYDNGVTWTGNPKIPYSGQVVAKQATEYYDHVQFYTDQMPVAVELQNGTIALALESRLDRDGNCYVTMAYSPDNWSVNIPKNGEGPADKQENMNRGGGPYLAQFPSGETVLKYSYSTIFNLKLGDPEARVFTKNALKFDDMKNFSSFELLSNGHTVICSGGAPYTDEKGAECFTVCTQRVNLNHALFLAEQEVTVDGNGAEWKNNGEALFVGSKSQAQMSVRFARSGEGLGVLIDRLDYDITSEDSSTVRIALPHNKLSYIEITVKGDGSHKAFMIADGEHRDITVQCAVTNFGKPDNVEDTDEGMLIELLIPSEYLPESISVCPALYNKDTGKAGTYDQPEWNYETVNTTWYPLK